MVVQPGQGVHRWGVLECDLRRVPPSPTRTRPRPVFYSLLRGWPCLSNGDEGGVGVLRGVRRLATFDGLRRHSSYRRSFAAIRLGCSGHGWNHCARCYWPFCRGVLLRTRRLGGVSLLLRSHQYVRLLHGLFIHAHPPDRCPGRGRRRRVECREPFCLQRRRHRVRGRATRGGTGSPPPAFGAAGEVPFALLANTLQFSTARVARRNRKAAK
mmetsp:Transcript_3817/g.11163  ORF Transcript_3817/g.11163 Transcript_3817/m.11163 type:complete len:212 (+) Transcript_3817:639-1274(+)